MFLGSFKYSIDPKGRISIPAKLRKFVASDANDTFVMTRGTKKCIVIYPMNHWQDLVASKLNKLNPFDPKDAQFLRMFLQPAAEDKFDYQSRLMIPKNLIEFAGIKKDIMILGVNQFMEIWDPDIYENYLKEQQQSYDEIAKEVMNI